MSAQDPRNKFKTDNYEKQDKKFQVYKLKCHHNQIVGRFLSWPPSIRWL